MKITFLNNRGMLLSLASASIQAPRICCQEILKQ